MMSGIMHRHSLRSNPGTIHGIKWGEPLDLKVTETGLIDPVVYQWLKDGASIPGQTSDTFHVDEIALSDAGSYTCQVTDSAKAIYAAGPVQILVFPATVSPPPPISALSWRASQWFLWHSGSFAAAEPRGNGQ